MKDDTVEVPERFLARWHATIERAARDESQARGRRLTIRVPVFLAAAVVTAFAVGLAIGARHGSTLPPAPTIVVDRINGGASGDPAVFVRGVHTYLLETRQELATMPADADGTRSLLIADIVEQNRAFEHAAERNNAQDVARVLRAFEPILLRLASDDIAPDDAESLRRQLSFELNVMLTKLSSRTSKASTTT